MSASWDWNDEVRLRQVVQLGDVELDRPKPSSPFEFDDSDPLGCAKGFFVALGFMAAACAVVVALYLLSLCL
jgi:hypothetical protein